MSQTAQQTVITAFKERNEHYAVCERCEAASQTGQACCEVGRELYVRIKTHSARRETPYVVRRKRTFGTGYVEVRNTGCWTLRQAKAQASVQGGEVIDQTHLYTVA